MKRMDVDLRRTIKELETGLRHDVKASETRLTLRLGSVVVIALGAMTTLTKLLWQPKRTKLAATEDFARRHAE